MSQSIEFKSRVGQDGVLDLHVPLGEDEAGTDVLVTIRPLTAASVVPPDWHGFVEETYGSCDGLGLERQPQGQIEQREPIE
jgi:NADH:ubiquinone oxidoreductase subunit